jgi:hypothetical protein
MFEASPVVKEKRYFAPIERRAEIAVSAEDQSSGDGGVVPNYKVPEDFVPRVASSRRFPGE